MVLVEYVAGIRKEILEDLLRGSPPRSGSFSQEVFKETKAKGEPQMGTTRFEPRAIILEFVYPDSRSAATVLSVRLEPPERIVFLPVPPWVTETIWQGHIDGSFHFESEALTMVREFEAGLSEEPNAKWFGPRSPKRRE